MSDRIGWHFPPTGGGMRSGINDAGIATFAGSRIPSLARETLQNSLDAAQRNDEPVHVTFELRHIDISRALHPDKLAEHLDACAATWANDPKASRALREARSTLDQSTLPFLLIVDSNTTGLSDARWTALVKTAGANLNESDGGGGSFGIGKSAPFVVSPLRTVCYWTYIENEGGGAVEKFQGKAVLTAHEHGNGDDRERQGTGFFGHVAGCKELRGADVPSSFRPDMSCPPEQGTAIWIAGFRGERGWQQEIARSVISSYFYAIHQRRLAVHLEPDPLTHNRLEEADIDESTLEQWFDHLSTNQDGAAPQNGPDTDEISEARTFWELVRSRPPTCVMDPPDTELGAPKLWIGTEDDLPGVSLPNKVALIRGSGMLITAQQKRIGNFRNLRDYAAVCILDDATANRLLRKMENPRHDQFEPDRLSEDPDLSPDQGNHMLERLRKWIREQLGQFAALPRVEVSTEISELAHLLPLDAPGPFAQQPGSDNREKAFGEMGAVHVKQIKRKVKPPDTADNPNDLPGEGGDGDDIGVEGGGPSRVGGGGNGTGGAGDGDGTGGTGPRGGERGAVPVELSDVRLLPIDRHEKRCRVSFTPRTNGTVQLRLEEAGDSSAMKRSDLKVLRNGTEQQLSDFKVSVTAGERVELEIRADAPLQNRAWRVIALEEPSQ